MTSLRLLAPTSDFGFALLREEVKARPGQNVLVSPASVALCLGSALPGARGKTRSAILKTLRMPNYGDAKLVNQAFGNLVRDLTGGSLDVELSLASAVWARQGVKINPEFLSTNKQIFGTEVNVADFGAPQTIKDINGWCAKKTKDRITKIVDQLPPAAVMLLLQATYFKAPWTVTFDKQLTDLQNFQGLGGSSQLPLMFRGGDMHYGQTDDYQMVSLPFAKSGRIKMSFILPSADKSVSDVLDTLTGAGFISNYRSLVPCDGHLWLPRYQMEDDITLNDSLEKLGLGEALSPKANFSGINSNMFISQIKHKTFKKVTEEGAEAAAVTSIGFESTSFDPRKISWNMRINRPFISVISDDNTNTILFASVVNDPQPVADEK
jgi:serine protease inhibitor